MGLNNSWKYHDWRVCKCGRTFDVPRQSTQRLCDGCLVKRFFLVLLSLAAVAVPVLAALSWAGVL